jgi:D-beta-D-heptose 7-phosphate kinase/D-beta-D-heptose 1-phosphate adenosyltransferase
MSRLLVIGDICQDVYVYGDVTRISPEAPVPVLNYHSEVKQRGMLANVVANLKSLGQDCDYLHQEENCEKLRVLDFKTNQQLIRIDKDPSEVEPIRWYNINWDEYTHLAIVDYNKGFITSEVADFICQAMKGKPIYVDSKKKDLSCYTNCIIKINEKEKQESFNIDESNELIVTLGDRGAEWNDTLYDAEHDVGGQLVDVCGAGDVFFASLISSQMKGDNLEDSIRIANYYAAISVTYPGVYTLQKEDLING